MDPAQLPAPPEPPQPHRSSTSCDRHPSESFTGFCPSCLCERLSLLDKSTSSAASSSARKSTSSSAAILKSIFKPNKPNEGPTSSKPKQGSTSASFLPELRRTQSFSGRKNEGFLGLSGGFEPQRKSCDVRGRSTLFSLLTQDNTNQGNLGERESVLSARVEEEFHECGDHSNGVSEIEGVKEEVVVGVSGGGVVSEQVGEIVEEEEDFKTMKDHIDLDLHPKKVVGPKDLKELGGKSSKFWSAASVFSKKLKSWAKKNNQKMMKKSDHIHGGSSSVKVGGKKVSGGGNGRSYRDTQSEIAEYGYGRRSCDTDPRVSFDVGRFSVDVAAGGRFSFDDPRCSFDEPPRASWDGYLMVGGRGFPPPPKMVPPMVSLVEDPGVVVSRKDGQIPVEEQPRRSSVSINGGEDCCGVVPGGAAQTKDYYSDSSSRRRKSLDRSSSIRKTAASVVAEMDEMKNSNNFNNINNVCNGRMSTGSLAGIDRDVRDLRDQLSSNSRSLSRDDCSEMGYWDNIDKKGGPKKPSRWRGWNIWGLIYRRGNPKQEEDDRFSRANGVGRSFSETWQERGGFNRHMLRSNSSVSWRNSFDIGGGGGSLRKGVFETNNNSRKKRGEGFVLERNRSARYSPSHTDNVRMLPMYLNPAARAGSRKGGGSKPAYSHSFVRSALRMY